MPANIGTLGAEHDWDQAKRQAAREGHDRDWPYVVGIYKRMTVNKSFFEEPPPTLRLFARVRDPGQVPSRDRLAQMAQLDGPATTWSVHRHLDRPRMSPRSVVDGLGLAPDWERFVGQLGDDNEVVARRRLWERMRAERLDPALKAELFDRTMGYRRELRRSVRVWDPTALRKSRAAQPVTQDVLEVVDREPTGAAPADFDDLEAQYGTEVVAQVLRRLTESGQLAFQNDRVTVVEDDGDGPQQTGGDEQSTAQPVRPPDRPQDGGGGEVDRPAGGRDSPESEDKRPPTRPPARPPTKG